MKTFKEWFEEGVVVEGEDVGAQRTGWYYIRGKDGAGIAFDMAQGPVDFIEEAGPDGISCQEVAKMLFSPGNILKIAQSKVVNNVDKVEADSEMTLQELGEKQTPPMAPQAVLDALDAEYKFARETADYCRNLRRRDILSSDGAGNYTPGPKMLTKAQLADVGKKGVSLGGAVAPKAKPLSFTDMLSKAKGEDVE